MGIVGSAIKSVHALAGNATVVALSKAWIGIGSVAAYKRVSADFQAWKKRIEAEKAAGIEIGSGIYTQPDRMDYTKLYSLQLGDYFMPLSQIFTLRARKKLNVSQLVDGPDIIQQTRMEAKTIDCTLRIGLRPEQANLQIVDTDNQLVQLAAFFQDLYTTNAVFMVANDVINNTFGVQYVVMTEYRFIPRHSMGTFTFEFTLTEVQYEENVVTLDLSNRKKRSTLTGD